MTVNDLQIQKGFRGGVVSCHMSYVGDRSSFQHPQHPNGARIKISMSQVQENWFTSFLDIGFDHIPQWGIISHTG